MPSTTSVASIAGMLAMLPTALAGFSAGSSKNIAVYWGKFLLDLPLQMFWN